MIYQVHQIHLTQAEVSLVNKTGDHAAVPANALKQKMSFARGRLGGYAAEALGAGYYTHVANITAEDIDHVFEIGNIGPESNIERFVFCQMHSISVGDVIVGNDGTVNVVDTFGFVTLTHESELVES
jgi:hypothetical protein